MKAEYNHKYYQKHRKTFDFTGLGLKTKQTLRALSVEQIEAIVDLILLGYHDEIPIDNDTVGKWTKPGMADKKIKLKIVATLVFLSGRLAEEIPLLEEGIYRT